MEIERLRSEIDKIDDQMTALYKKRLEIVKNIGEEKKKTDKSVFDPNREQNILLRVTQGATDEESLYLKRFFESVFETSKAYQTANSDKISPITAKIKDAVSNIKSDFPVRAKVACQGVAGAYSGIAANKLFEIADVTYFKTFDAVFTAVEKGFCKYGVLPIENSTAGSVNQVYDLMREHNFYIVKSIRIPIQHCLVAKKGVELKDIKEIVSHEQALSQCRKYLEKTGAKITAVANTAVAAESVKNSDRTDLGAICSRESATLYDLKILDSAVSDSDGNYTRFILIAKEMEIYDDAKKVSIMTTLLHSPGALYKLLAKFYNAGINMTKLESRPIVGSNFEFTFYFDFECDVKKNAVRSLIAELDSSGESFTFLGAYSEKV